MSNMMPVYLGLTKYYTHNEDLINMKNVEYIEPAVGHVGAQIHFVSGCTLDVNEQIDQIFDALFCNVKSHEM